MVEHHIQKDILYKLVTSPSARFAELKPKTLDGNIFTYHLQQLIKNKYVEKQEDGSYHLTSLGKNLGINIQLKAKELLEQAHSVFLLIIRNEKGDWLLRKRLAHPMYGKYGFVHGEPVARLTLQEAAAAALQQRTGLTAMFKPIGHGYIKFMLDDEVESFTHCTFLEGSELTGELIKETGNGENTWLSNPDFNGADMIPSMMDIVSAMETQNDCFFVELTYQITGEQ
jgi:hypothetical protein